MRIAGLQKLTLLDYPDTVAATVFLGGCNYRCPFCHNGSLVTGKGMTEIPREEFFSFLNKRKGLLDGVCVSGGEPLIHEDLAGFLSAIRDMGYSVKLDTNGSFPDRLKELVSRGLVDYVAMDIKNSPAKYAVTAGITIDLLPQVRDSIRYLLHDPVDYEFRTTLVQAFHTKDDMEQIGHWIRGAKRYYLQNFLDSGDILEAGHQGLREEQLTLFADLVRPYVPSVQIRRS